jgi:hypothetical protein
MPLILKETPATLLTCTWKMPCSRLGQDIDDPEVLLVSIIPLG